MSQTNKMDLLMQSGTCGCVGPAPGYPLCPCAMRGIQVINGRFVRPAQDLGPVPTDYDPLDPGGRNRKSFFETLQQSLNHTIQRPDPDFKIGDTAYTDLKRMLMSQSKASGDKDLPQVVSPST